MDGITHSAQQAQHALLQEANSSGMQRAEELASALLSVGKNNPDSLLALSHLPGDNNLPPNSALRQACLMAFIGILQQYNDHYLLHLITATFCVTTVSRSERALQLQRSLWMQKKRLLFTEISRLSKLASHNNPLTFLRLPTLTVEQRWYILVVAMSNNQTHKIGEVLRQAMPYLPVHQRQTFTVLLHYPLDSMPGSKVIYKQQQGILINHLSLDRALVWLPKNREFADVLLSKAQVSSGTKLTLSQWEERLHQSQISALATKSLSPRSYPVSKLPADLASIISMLQDQALDINKLVSALNNQPDLADFLKQMAGQENRLRIAVSDVKQAVMTYGLQRLADMLVLRALTQRLQQKGFPLLLTCNRVCDVIASIASRLAEISAVCSLTPQCAALLTTFSVAPLYSVPALKTRKKWPMSTGPAYRLDRFAKDSNGTLQKMAVTLASQWQQPPLYQSIISHSNLFPADIPQRIKADTVILGMSLLLTNQWLFNGISHEKDDLYYRTSLKILQVSDAEILSLRRDICPLLWLPMAE